MNNRRERTLQDLCDATPTISQPQITPVLSGNFRMQGPVDEANSNLLTHTVVSESNKGFISCSDRSQKVDCRGKSGTCNVCSAPCSSCFHGDKVLMKSNEESAGETCTENIETGQLSEVSTVAGMNSTADSFSENAVGKASSRTSNVSASDDTLAHSKSESRKVLEAHDDCLSCISGTDGHAYKNSDAEDNSVKYNKQRTGESSDKVPRGSSSSGLESQNSGFVEIPFRKHPDDTNDLLDVHNDFSQTSDGKYMSCNQNLRDVKYEKPYDVKAEQLGDSIEHLDSLSPGIVASDICGDPSAAALKSIKKNDDMEVDNHPIDGTDDSDIVEHDVKVCDICGDAGREDLLAVCCRCSDGAEHTYCMREMLTKVPEGEWLCEECKTVVDNERQQKLRKVDENEKNNSSGQASSEYVNSSEVEGHRTKCYKRTGSKRHRDDADAEVSSVVKKPALESIVGSPKTTNSSKISVLSRENSSKNLDKRRLQSSHQSCSENIPVSDATESAGSASDLRVPNFRGTYSKSNSFNNLNSKPKVKLVDQVVIRRQKSVKEPGSFRLKEGVIKSIGKSMSFKSTSSSRLESKTKMLSPRPSLAQDARSTKQKSSFERQRSFRTDHNSVLGTSSSTSKVDRRPASRGESSSPTTIGSHHEMKPVQTDSKSAALSRSSSLAVRRTVDSFSSLGEFKRPSIHSHGTVGISSAVGDNNIEQKSNQAGLKEDSSCSVVAEKPSVHANEGLPDGLARSGDTNSGERMKENFGGRFGTPSVKSSRDESDNLKAAIEAAVLRKPGVYRKNRSFGPTNDSSVSTMNCEAASNLDHISGSAGKKKLSSDEELPEKSTTSQNLTTDSLKQETLNNAKQSSLVPAEVSSRGGDGNHIGLSSRDMFSTVPATPRFLLKSIAIPEHEYIWQGSFMISRSCKPFDFWDGIQGHLSTCASPKVIEAVNKFSSRIVLREVPRLSTWPLHFQEHGVREDNIALFFFAKDLESYDKVYKVLLNNMMKNDLALKGDIDGVELLIFPSNQLPNNSQRWNMLFFLWGVFRGKKESCLQHMPKPVKNFSASHDIPPPIMSLPENRCSLKPIGESLPGSHDAAPAIGVPASEEVRNLLSSRAINGECGARVSFPDQLDSGLNADSSATILNDRAKQCQETKGTCQEEGISSRCSPPLALSSSSSLTETTPVHLDTPPDRPQSSNHSCKSLASVLKESVGEGTKLDKTLSENPVNLRMDAIDLTMDPASPLEDERPTRDLNLEPDRWNFNHEEEIMHPVSSVVPQPLFAGTDQVSLRNDDPRNETRVQLEKKNLVPSVSYALQNQYHEARVDPTIPNRNENAERHFFPIQSQPMKGLNLNEMHPLEQDRAPNLELALGAEKKPTTLGTQPLLLTKLDQSLNEEPPIEEEGAETKQEDDVSASLSLSLSFPFSDKELSTKSSPKTEQVVSKRKRVNTEMLFFGNLRDS